jgi:rsbT co-antagonist protein RsbR
MGKSPTSRLSDIVSKNEDSLVADWLVRIARPHDPRLPAQELHAQCDNIVSLLAKACRDGNFSDIHHPSFEPLRDLLVDVSLTRALQGFAATETATFILSIKAPIFARLRVVLASEPERLAADTMTMSELIDALALFTMDTLQRTREELIHRQQSEISELAMPVMRLWRGIVALPLIGTLDSARTHAVMEHLLESIVRHEAEVAIIDITGVPAIDLLVAQHLLKTIAAVRLMGAECIVSGIRPQIAQTMVQLGIELNVTSKANLSDAFALALRRVGKAVVDQRSGPPVELP